MHWHMLSDSVEEAAKSAKFAATHRNGPKNAADGGNGTFFAAALARKSAGWYDNMEYPKEWGDRMERREAMADLLREQCRRYPQLRPQDLLKALHQSVFGCGHFVTDEAGGLALLQRELAENPPAEEVELLGDAYCRVHLGALNRMGLAPERLFRLFALSAEAPQGNSQTLETGLEVLAFLGERGELPFPAHEMTAAMERWRAAGFPACHHSEPFRMAYRPAYRVIRKEYLRLLPLLAAIDACAARKEWVLVAVEGGSASGKTTLAALLKRIYDCNVFHMDDYFLRPEQRTRERLAEAGGNVDRERVREEILVPVSRGDAACWRRYDCHTQSLQEETMTAPKALTIVEGAYSMHPELAGFYDLSVFLRVSPELQKARIAVRNDPETAERFFSTWIPMEGRYFEGTDAAARCDLILEVDA